MDNLLFTDVAKDRILEALQRFFQQKDPPYRWNSNEKESQIFIGDKYSVNLETVASENLPAIIVNRGPMTWRNQTIDQNAGNKPNSMQSRVYMDLLDVTLVITAVARQGLEAEYLANLIFGFFQFYKVCLRGVPGIHDIKSSQLGMEQIGRSDSDIAISVVPVTVQLTLTQKWSISNDEAVAPILKCIRMTPEIVLKGSACANSWARLQRTLESNP